MPAISTALTLPRLGIPLFVNHSLCCTLLHSAAQITFYDVMRSGYEYSGRLTCPGSLGPPLCLATLRRGGPGGGHAPPGLVWGDTGEPLLLAVGCWCASACILLLRTQELLLVLVEGRAAAGCAAAASHMACTDTQSD